MMINTSMIYCVGNMDKVEEEDIHISKAGS